MGTILTFQPAPHGERPAASSMEMGKLLLFTGIRYQRDAESKEPDERPRGRRAKSRRRS